MLWQLISAKQFDLLAGSGKWPDMMHPDHQVYRATARMPHTISSPCDQDLTLSVHANNTTCKRLDIGYIGMSDVVRHGRALLDCKVIPYCAKAAAANNLVTLYGFSCPRNQHRGICGEQS